MGIDLSVIIPTRNRPDSLAVTLASIAGGRFPPDRWELIVADNGTNAANTQTIAQLQNRVAHIRHLPVPRPGLHEARHAGLAAAQSEILVYADDDIVAGPDWLASIQAAFADPSVAIVGGNNLPRYAHPPPPWLRRLWNVPCRHGRCIEALSILDFGPDERDIPATYAFGCNFSVRRKVVEDAGGFHPDGFPAELIKYRGDGETHISNHVAERGLRTRLVPGAWVEHCVSADRMKSSYFEQRYFAQGVSDSYARIRAGLPSRHCFSLRHALRLARPPALMLRRIRWQIAHHRGFVFHRRAVAEDSSLLAWVRQTNYLQ